VSPLRIGVVLDATAVRRFQTARDVAVGELIGEVSDDQALVAIPVTAVAECRGSAQDPDAHAMLALLTAPDRNVVVWPLRADEGLEVGAIAARVGGDVPLAQAIHLARRAKAQLATEHGDKVRAVSGEMHGVLDI
jgi:hypothetical protein